MSFWALVCILFAGLISAGRASGYDPLRDSAEEAYGRWQTARTATPEEKTLMETVFWPATGIQSDAGLDDSGAPDNFGYRWVDNQNSDTVQYEWIELCGDPLAQFGPTGDDQTGVISWSFSFPFYGETYSSAYVSINGKLTFVSGDGAWFNRCLTVDAVQPTINVHWDDLVAQQTEDCGSGTPRIKYRDFGEYLVVEWNYVWHFPDLNERFTFELILFADGLIKMQYQSFDCLNYCHSSTVSIDVPGANGVEYVCNGVPANHQLSSGRAVCFFAIPTGPQELVIHPSAENALLYWRAEANAISYSVYRGYSPDIQPTPLYLIATVNDTFYIDSGVLGAPDLINFYLVTANR